MNQPIIYQWFQEIAMHMPGVSRWQAYNLAAFSQGVVRAQSCQQRQIALKLPELGRRTTVERRLQRFLDNTHLNLERGFVAWTRWVVGALEVKAVVLLVDETKLSDHLCCMMVGLAYEGRCIPLAWRCYAPAAYPEEGQVKLIEALLRLVAAGLPRGCVPLVEADRGIGTSPALLRVIDALGWRYLVRVTRQSKLVTDAGAEYTIYAMAQPGEVWAAAGRVFKKRGLIPARALARWAEGAAEPWALVTNDPILTGQEYATRAWQEQSFRDLKSHGWQWQRSHVWVPDHADRLLLLLALAYAWVLALGAYFVHFGQATPVRTTTHGFRRRYSLFQEGVHHFHDLIQSPTPVCFPLFFAVDKRLC
jgi:hypothetical protein